MNVWIGTSGYSYPDWVGDFYPEGTRPANMLPYYCRFFPLVELNFTFYRPPTLDTLGRLADKKPEGFQFVVKLPRTLSHERNPSDLPGFRAAVEELRHRNKLMGLLCQLPQSTHYEKKAVNWLERLGQELADFRLAVEFRHRSWFRPRLTEWMAKQHLDLVAVDVPDLPALFPRGWVQSGRRAYVRLHSRNAANWYRSEKQRYDYNYDDSALGEWVESLCAAEDRTDEVLFLFNNCFRGQAIENGRRMRVQIEERAPEVHLVATPSAQQPWQGSLFG